jgi:hypothetical protein
VPQAEGPEVFRVQPDTPPAPPIDAGIHSWPIGSYAPMAFYRPKPIVDFTRTVLVQFLLNLVLQAWLAGVPGIFALGAYTIVAIVTGRRAYVRWLAPASTTWKVATITAVALNLLFASFVTLARGCGAEDLVTGLEQAAAARTTSSEGCEPSMAELVVGYEELLRYRAH